MTLAFAPRVPIFHNPFLLPKPTPFRRSLHVVCTGQLASSAKVSTTSRTRLAPVATATPLTTKEAPPDASPGIRTPNAPPQKPGLLEDFYFPPSQATLFWRNYDAKKSPQVLARSFQDHARLLPTLLQNFRSLAYWFFALSRFTFFSSFGPSVGIATGLSLGTNTESWTPKASASAGLPVVLKSMAQNMDKTLHAFRQDFENVRNGVYKMPWDAMLFHRQNNPLRVIRETSQLLAEIISISSKFTKTDNDVSVWLESNLLPDYYKQAYHFQTDGWLSSTSANRYEMSTEAIFLGGQDAMQRLTLLPMSEYIRNAGVPEKELNIVEVAAGTGRVATFVRDNWPRAQYTISDLSPFYLQNARENMSYWESKRTDSSTQLGRVRFLQAAAEDLPLADESADIIYSVYLFHELPPQVRRKVLKEVERVLKPGGLFVLTDSIQLGDTLSSDETIHRFSKLNEPWYETYIREPFAELLCGDGRFKPMVKEVRASSKMLSFTKCA